MGKSFLSVEGINFLNVDFLPFENGCTFAQIRKKTYLQHPRTHCMITESLNWLDSVDPIFKLSFQIFIQFLPLKIQLQTHTLSLPLSLSFSLSLFLSIYLPLSFSLLISDEGASQVHNHEKINLFFGD